MRPVPLPQAFLRRPIAHRALHDKTAGRPENTRAAITAAIAAGYPVEIDVQLSADGQAMVFHDEAMKRLTARPGLLHDHSAAILQTIPLLHSDETIPTLPQILALIAGRVPVLIEIKDQDGQMGPAVGALERACADALQGYQGLVALMSFNPHSMHHMGQLTPHLPRGLTTSLFDHADWAPLHPQVCDHLRDIPDYDRVGASFISHEWQDLSRPRVAELHAKGAAILCWTIKNAEQEAQARVIAQNITFERYPAAIAA